MIISLLTVNEYQIKDKQYHILYFMFVLSRDIMKGYVWCVQGSACVLAPVSILHSL